MESRTTCLFCLRALSAFQVIEQLGLVVDRAEQDVVNNHTIAGVLCFGAARLEKGISFGGEDMHETGVETRGVARAKGHDTKGLLFVVG